MATYTLTYFDGKGLAETTRLLFCAAGTPFTEVRLPYSRNADGTAHYPEFLALKPSLPMGQVPLLEVKKADGTSVRLVQSKAIERYVAGETGLGGNNSEDFAIIDSICESVVDIKNKFNGVSKDEAKKAAFFAPGGDLSVSLGFFEKYASAAGSGYLVGSSLSLADVSVYHLFTLWFSGDDKAAAAASLAAAPSVAGAVAKTASNAGLAKWEADREGRKEVF
jgi:glutathione S-transferase